MKTRIKGLKSDLKLKFSEIWKTLPEDKIIQIEINDIRSLTQNNFLHRMIRAFADYTGENDFEQIKKDIKLALGYYKDERIQVGNTTHTITTYDETSSMNSKELSEFILKFETWALQNYDFIFDQSLKNDNKLY